MMEQGCTRVRTTTEGMRWRLLMVDGVDDDDDDVNEMDTDAGRAQIQNIGVQQYSNNYCYGILFSALHGVGRGWSRGIRRN